MNELKLEYLKLKKKTRSWLGPILVFWLIMLAFPLTVEFMQDKLEIVFSLGTSEDLLLSISVIPLSIISSYIFLNLFALGSALSLNKGSLLGALITMPLALPVLIVLGKSIIAFQLGINYLEFILLLLGCLSIIIIAVPIIVSFIIKAHLE